MSLPSLSGLRAAIVSVVRGTERWLRVSVGEKMRMLKRMFHADSSIIAYENDSTDGTLVALQELQESGVLQKGLRRHCPRPPPGPTIGNRRWAV